MQIGVFIQSVWNGLGSVVIHLFGYSFSLLDLFIFSCVCGIVGTFIWSWFDRGGGDV